MSLLQGNFNLGVNNTGDFNQGAATFQSLSPTVECMSQVLTMHLWRHSGMWNNGTGNAGTYNLGLNNTGNFNRGISNNGDGNQGELITLSYIYIYIFCMTGALLTSKCRCAGTYNAGQLNSGNHNSGVGNTGNKNNGESLIKSSMRRRKHAALQLLLYYPFAFGAPSTRPHGAQLFRSHQKLKMSSGWSCHEYS